MFVGFIAVVVILLVIVGLMASGVTGGSGGVDQTKATKALSEMSALVQSIGFYKTTTTNSDYSGISIAALTNAGIVATADTTTPGVALDVEAIAGTGVTAGGVAATDTVIKSKAVGGLYYLVDPTDAASVGGTTGIDVNYFTLRTTVDTNSVPASLRASLDSSYGKLGAEFSVDSNNTDGLVLAVFK